MFIALTTMLKNSNIKQVVLLYSVPLRLRDTHSIEYGHVLE